MAVVTLTPNGVKSGASNYTITGGSPSINAALSDGSDATYIRRTSTTTTTSVQVRFSTTSLGATQRIWRWRQRIRCQTPTADSSVWYEIGTSTSTDPDMIFSLGVLSYTRNGVRSLATYEDGWSYYGAFGNNNDTWTQEEIDGLVCKITDYAPAGADRAYTYELYLDLDIRNQPTTTVSAPTGVQTTARPTVTWTFSDPDGDPQASYTVKVFSADQYSAAGFDPETSTPTWSTSAFTDDLSVAVGSDLPNGAYRAYVKVGKWTYPTMFSSAWAYSSFTVSVAVPTIPRVDASYSSGTGSVALTLTGAAPTGFDSQTFDVQRSDDSGVTWTDVRGGTGLVPNGSYVATLTDYEAKRATNVLYRSRVIGVLSGVSYTSAWQEGYVSLPGTAGNYLSTPDAAALDITGDLELVARVALTDWTPAAVQVVLAKWDASTNCSYALRVDVAGTLALTWTTTGAVGATITKTSTVALGVADNRAYWIKATLDVNNGAAGNDVKFYWADDQEDEPSVWTQLGATVTTAGVTSIYSGSATLAIGAISSGSNLLTGRAYRAIVRNGIGGTSAFDADMTRLTNEAATTFSATTGQTVTLAQSGSPATAIVSAAAVTTNDGLWWFKPVTSPTLNMGGVRVQHGFAETLREDVGVFYPLGRGSAVVVSSGTQGYEGSYDVVALTSAEWAALRGVIEHTGVVLVEYPDGTSRYVRFVSRSVAMEGTLANPTRRVSLGFVPVTG